MNTDAGHDRPSPRPRRRWLGRLPLLASGLVLTAAVLALVAGLLVGSLSGPATLKVDEPRSAARLVAEPAHIFDRYSAPTPSPTAAPVVAPPLGSTPFQLLIPRIGVEATVNAFGLNAEAIPEVPRNGQEVAWYNWSSEPGMGSNAVFAGHVTWGGAGVFYNLEQLSGGDQILLRSADGVELSYTVEENFLIDPNDPSSLELMAPTNDDTITVITCGGAYSPTGGQFGGWYSERRVVRATLSQVTPAPDAVVAAN
ncbi:MAG: class F sortase [Chloroflexi bacterium]|nr:class F sortase [Chloroflexota bacterium]